MYEDMETDDGVAYTSENFDDFFPDMDTCCDGDFEGCMFGDEDNAKRHCQCFSDCKKEYESYD